MQSWQFVLLDPARVILVQIGQFLVNLLLVIFTLILGWIIARVVKTLITGLLKAIKADDFSEKINLEGILEKGGIKYSFSELIGVSCYWLVMLVTFMVAANFIQLTVVASLLDKIVLYIPNIVAAIFILVVAMFVAVLLKNIIQASAANIGISQVNLIIKVVESAIAIFAVLMALDQLKIGGQILEKVVLVALASAGLAAALAFGLGCKDIAGKITGELLDKIKAKK